MDSKKDSVIFSKAESIIILYIPKNSIKSKEVAIEIYIDLISKNLPGFVVSGGVLMETNPASCFKRSFISFPKIIKNNHNFNCSIALLEDDEAIILIGLTNLPRQLSPKNWLRNKRAFEIVCLTIIR